MHRLTILQTTQRDSPRSGLASDINFASADAMHAADMKPQSRDPFLATGGSRGSSGASIRDCLPATYTTWLFSTSGGFRHNLLDICCSFDRVQRTPSLYQASRPHNKQTLTSKFSTRDPPASRRRLLRHTYSIRVLRHSALPFRPVSTGPRPRPFSGPERYACTSTYA
jgi:hypothetical protein